GHCTRTRVTVHAEKALTGFVLLGHGARKFNNFRRKTRFNERGVGFQVKGPRFDRYLWDAICLGFIEHLTYQRAPNPAPLRRRSHNYLIYFDRTSCSGEDCVRPFMDDRNEVTDSTFLSFCDEDIDIRPFQTTSEPLDNSLALGRSEHVRSIRHVQILDNAV